MCEFCEEYAPLYTYKTKEGQPIARLRLNRDNKTAMHTVRINEQGVSIPIPVNYCPMCGRKLSEDK